MSVIIDGMSFYFQTALSNIKWNFDSENQVYSLKDLQSLTAKIYPHVFDTLRGRNNDAGFSSIPKLTYGEILSRVYLLHNSIN